MSPTSALILAAGLGTRLDPITRLVAKPAAPLGTQTLVEHVLAWLRRQAVSDVVLNLHHRPDTITGVLGDGAHLGMTIRYSWEHPVLGSAGGPRHALPLLNSDPFLIVNGDTLCDFDLAPMLEAHRGSGADVTMAVIANPAPHHYNGILVDRDDAVTGFIPKGHTVPSWHFVGVQITQQSVFAGLHDGVAAETVAGIYRERIASAPGRVRVWRVTSDFLDIGTPRDYLAAALRQDQIQWSRAGVAASARIARSAVWPEATVGDYAVIEDCIVAGNVRIPDGFQARGAILLPATCVLQTDAVRVDGEVAIFPLRP